jgi:hypothetical protein
MTPGAEGEGVHDETRSVSMGRRHLCVSEPTTRLRKTLVRNDGGFLIPLRSLRPSMASRDISTSMCKGRLVALQSSLVVLARPCAPQHKAFHG